MVDDNSAKDHLNQPLEDHLKEINPKPNLDSFEIYDRSVAQFSQTNILYTKIELKRHFYLIIYVVFLKII